jgi:hypothetical protein
VDLPRVACGRPSAGLPRGSGALPSVPCRRAPASAWTASSARRRGQQAVLLAGGRREAAFVTPAAANRCTNGVSDRISGRVVCIHVGGKCVAAHNAKYRARGCACVNGRLRRVRKAAISVGDASVAEGSSGATTLGVPVTLSADERLPDRRRRRVHRRGNVERLGAAGRPRMDELVRQGQRFLQQSDVRQRHDHGEARARIQGPARPLLVGRDQVVRNAAGLSQARGRTQARPPLWCDLHGLGAGAKIGRCRGLSTSASRSRPTRAGRLGGRGLRSSTRITSTAGA